MPVWRISILAVGEVVPMPILPDDCWIMNCDAPTTSPPVAMVEVATVEVALKCPNVGVEVADNCPFAMVERREFMEMLGKATVPVAVRLVTLVV